MLCSRGRFEASSAIISASAGSTRFGGVGADPVSDEAAGELNQYSGASAR
jgi:hypothetical protein